MNNKTPAVAIENLVYPSGGSANESLKFSAGCQAVLFEAVRTYSVGGAYTRRNNTQLVSAIMRDTETNGI